MARAAAGRRQVNAGDGAARASVAMATYNGLPYVRRQLDSILDQIATTDQLVIVDDASSDGTWEYLQTLRHPALELFRHATNLGIRASFQEALAACRNDIVFLSDQDDIWLPPKRAVVMRTFATRPDVVLVTSDARVIDADDRVIGTSFMQTRGGFRGSVLSTILKNRYLGCTMVLRRSVLPLALPIPRGAPMHDMWLGAMGAFQGAVAYIDEPLLDYRRHGRNASPSTHRPMLRMIRWRVAFAAAIVSRLFARRFRRTALQPR